MGFQIIQSVVNLFQLIEARLAEFRTQVENLEQTTADGRTAANEATAVLGRVCSSLANPPSPNYRSHSHSRERPARPQLVVKVMAVANAIAG